MKQLFFPLLAGLGIICCSRMDARAQKQEFKQHISKAFTLQKGVGGVLALYNLNGSLNVEGYSGDKVLIEIDERLTADDNETLEAGKKEFKLGFDRLPTASSSILRSLLTRGLATIVTGDGTGGRSDMISTWLLR